MANRDFHLAVRNSLDSLNWDSVDKMANAIAGVRNAGGRLFIVGNGGGAAHASHAVCDFRKLCGIDAHCPTDNVFELTARINDEGFDTAYTEWLKAMGAVEWDALLVVSVGGGSVEPKISWNIVNAIVYAQNCGLDVLAIVGDARTPGGGYAGEHATVRVVIPCDNRELVTPVVESLQSAVLHAMAVHPLLQQQKAKWESMEAAQ